MKSETVQTQTWKKVVAVVLAIALVLGFSGMRAFAADDTPKNDFNDQVNEQVYSVPELQDEVGTQNQGLGATKADEGTTQQPTQGETNQPSADQPAAVNQVPSATNVENAKSYTVELGQEIKIESSKGVFYHYWSSSNDDIAVVDGTLGTGVVTGLKLGKVTITHEYGEFSRHYEQFTVEVIEPSEYRELMVGETKTIESSEGYFKHNEWKSRDNNIAVASGDSNIGSVTGISEGFVLVKHSWGTWFPGSEYFPVKVTPDTSDQFDVSMALADDQKTYDWNVGDTVKYNVTVKNLNKSAAIGPVTVTDTARNEVEIESIPAGGEKVITTTHKLTEEDKGEAGAFTNIATATYKSTSKDSEPVKITFAAYEKDFDISKAFSADQKKTTDFNAGDKVLFDLFVRNDSGHNIENVIVEEKLEGATIVAEDGSSYIVNDDGTATIPRIVAGDMVVVKAEYMVTAEDYAAKKQILNTADATYAGFTKTSNAVAIVPESLPKVEVYVYMKVGGFTDDALEALGLSRQTVTNVHGYAPVGVLKVDASFFTEGGYDPDWATRQFPMLRNADDWARFKAAIVSFNPNGMQDSGGYQYSKNNGNSVTVEQILLARQDYNYQSGSDHTALFTQDGSTYTTEFEGKGSREKCVHLDCVFDTVKVNFVDEAGNPVYVKDGKVVDKNTPGAKPLEEQKLVKGQHATEPKISASKSDETIEFCHKDTGAKWNFATDTVEKDTTIVVKITKKVPGLKVKKVVNNAGAGDKGEFLAGETAKFTITVQNTGNYALTNVVVEDTLNGATINESPEGKYTIEDGKAVIARLDGGTKDGGYKDGEKVNVYAQYTITPTDVEKGVKNTATATASDETTGTGETPNIPVTAGPKLTAKKVATVLSGSPDKVKAGDVVTYTVLVKNEGSSTATNLELEDNMAPAGTTFDKTTLAPNDTAKAVYTYTVTVDDINNQKKIENTAYVSGKDGRGNDVVSERVTETITPAKLFNASNPENTTYNGTEQKMPVEVTDQDGKKLVEGTDYIIEYTPAVDAGGVTVTIKGIDNYTGSATRFYQITPAPLTITTPSATKTYDGTALTAAGTITGLVNGETATLTTTGSQTAVGSSQNTYSLAWGTANPNNYSITENLGTLTVTSAPTPGPTPGPTPNPPVTPGGGGGGGTVTPAGTAGTDTPAATETVQNNPTPQAAAKTTIKSDSTPMAAFDNPWCWVHWYILAGLVLTLIYSAVVIGRRSSQIGRLNKMDGGEKATEAAPSTQQQKAGA